MKILIIEDDSAVRNFINISLKAENHTVVEADNGLNGLKLLQDNPDIEVVITDIIMPEKEGIETIIAIKKQYPAVKILAISGGGKLDSENYLVMAKALGAHKTLKKPFKGSELLNTIAKL
jgi:DNA-binding response OmpR family regulator